MLISRELWEKNQSIAILTLLSSQALPMVAWSRSGRILVQISMRMGSKTFHNVKRKLIMYIATSLSPSSFSGPIATTTLIIIPRHLPSKFSCEPSVMWESVVVALGFAPADGTRMREVRETHEGV